MYASTCILSYRLLCTTKAITLSLRELPPWLVAVTPITGAVAQPRHPRCDAGAHLLVRVRACRVAPAGALTRWPCRISSLHARHDDDCDDDGDDEQRLTGHRREELGELW
ncbi:hypothetical protein BHE74_00054666, partial [Ensete ventricosum]